MTQISAFKLFRMRTYLALIGMKRRMTIGARMLLVDGEKVLLVKPSYVPGWQLPGGGVEPGETVLKAAVRETFEETGYQVEGVPQLHGVFHNDGLSNRDHVCLFISTEFVCVREFAPNEEIVECKWFDKDALPKDINAGAALRVEEYFNHQAPRQQWA